MSSPLSLDELIARLVKIREGMPGTTLVTYSNDHGGTDSILGVTGRVTVDGVNPPKVEVFLS